MCNTIPVYAYVRRQLGFKFAGEGRFNAQDGGQRQGRQARDGVLCNNRDRSCSKW